MFLKNARVADLFWNILIVGFVNLLVDLVILFLFHEEAAAIMYYAITIITTLVLVFISAVVVFVRVKDSLLGKFLYSVIAFLLSLILFYFTSFSLVTYLPQWIFP